MTMVRLRLRFDESCGLGEGADGLLQWWFSVPPSMRSIADVAAEIVSVFQLQRSCPRGVVLLMEDFALLPMQAVSLLKDRDLVSVKPKGLFSKARGQLDQAAPNQYITHAVSNGAQIFRINAIEEFEKESGGYRSEDEDFGLNLWNEDQSTELNGRPVRTKGGTHLLKRDYEPSVKNYGDSKQQESRKRKNRHCSKEGDRREASKKEKKRSVGTSENADVASSEDDLKAAKRRKKEHCKDSNEIFKKEKKKTSENADVLATDENLKAAKRRKGNDTKKERKKTVGTFENAFSDEDTEAAKRIKHTGKDADLIKDQTAWKDLKPEENSREDMKSVRRRERQRDNNYKARSSDDVAGEDLHLTSRVEELDDKTDAEAVKGEGEDQMSKGPSRSARRKKAKRQWLRRQAELNRKADSSEDIQNNEHDQMEKESDGKTIGSQLVMVAPGHVRFEPLDSDEENAVKLPMPVVNLGTEFKSKRHGQSWGRERPSGRQGNNNQTRQRWENETPECQDDGCNERVQMQLDYTSRTADINFEELPQLQGFPKEEDVLAYKLVELSLTRTPELSSFRVGKVACFDRSSNHIKMIPVPQYPIDRRQDEEQDDVKELSESYQEDGSLEIDFSFLLDVRVLKRASGGDAENADSCPAAVDVKNETNLQQSQNKTVTDSGLKGEWTDWVAGELEKKKQELSLKPVGSSKPSGVEEVSLGSARNVQTSQDIPLALKSGKSDRWRLKSLKAAALGPTVALLRAQYDKEQGSNPVLR